EDASNLNNLHEAPLLALLRRRFRQGQIYTSTGNLLISVNPYRPIPGLYDEDISGERPRAPTGLGPHVYSVAAGAWKRAAAGQDQSVVITGESGAGKTEACKQVMRRLVQINQKLTGRDFGDQIEMSLLQSNVVLEAFGNAKTLRNDNSSRFGKYVRLLYRRPLVLVGARTSTFVLEKSRLAGPAAGERNYHVFYQLCAARGGR
ncbi:unnamed protein product, partial [Heterosigma akashiwo]